MTSPTVLSLRVSPRERDLLQTAAGYAHTNLSDFVRRRAVEAAEMDVTGHPVVVIPAQDWERFESWANAPARDVPALRALLARPPVWEG